MPIEAIVTSINFPANEPLRVRRIPLKDFFPLFNPISLMVNPVLLRAFRVAGIGPNPMVLGGTPAAAEVIIRAKGFKLSWEALSAFITSNAAAPSFNPEEFPAVTVPSFRNAGFNRDNASIEVSRRGLSSVSTVSGSFFRRGTLTGTIS